MEPERLTSVCWSLWSLPRQPKWPRSSLHTHICRPRMNFNSKFYPHLSNRLEGDEKKAVGRSSLCNLLRSGDCVVTLIARRTNRKEI